MARPSRRLRIRRARRTRRQRLGTALGDLTLNVRTTAWLGRLITRQGGQELRFRLARAQRRLR